MQRMKGCVCILKFVGKLCILSDIEQFQDAQCDDIPSGSLSKSSKKRRGRPPAVLMEPRKEADKPVLTPNGRE